MSHSSIAGSQGFPFGKTSQKELHTSCELGQRQLNELDLLKKELSEFDKKTIGLIALPMALRQWRERKIKAIEKEEKSLKKVSIPMIEKDGYA